MIKGIVFDLFGVNAHRNEELTLCRIAKMTNTSVRRVRRALKQAGRDQLKIGRCDRLLFLCRFNRYLGNDDSLPTYLDDSDFVQIWNSTLQVDDEMMQQLRSLKEEYRLFLLSNLNCFDWRAIVKTEIPEHFDDLFLSFKVRLKKPDRKAFDMVSARTHLHSQNLLLVDDKLQNIEAAAQYGFQTIHFTSPEQFKAEFARLIAE